MRKILFFLLLLISANVLATDLLDLTYTLADKNFHKIAFTPRNEGAGWNTRIRITKIKAKITDHSGSTLSNISRKLRGKRSEIPKSEVTLLCNIVNDRGKHDECKVVIVFYDSDGFEIGKINSPETELYPNLTNTIQWSHWFSDNDVKRMKEANIFLENKGDMDDLMKLIRKQKL